MSLAVDWPLRKISEPHERNDVLLLTDSNNSNNDTNSSEGYNLTRLEGNKRLMALVHSRKDDFDNKSRLEKPLVAVEILKEWRNQQPPGRFLIQEFDSFPPLYKDVGDKKARNYISKLLKKDKEEKVSPNVHHHHHEQQCSSKQESDEVVSNQQHTESKRSTRKELNLRSVASKLYEREEHIGKLIDAFERSRLQHNKSNDPGRQELVLITGPSGSGKSQLARSIEDLVTTGGETGGGGGGFFLWGKYDQLRRTTTKSYSAFLAAIEQFAEQIQMKGDEDWKNKVIASIHASVGSEISILVEAMPFLRDFLGLGQQKEEPLQSTSTNHTTQAGGAKDSSKKRFVIAFRRFVRAILDPEHPIVILLDDIQWACLGSLELLHSLVSPEFGNRQGLLIVGTCRANEVSVNDPLSAHLRELEEEGTIITTIEVTNLSLGTLKQMIVDAGMPAEQGSKLAEIVHDQTKGNAFFSTQYLQNLQEEGLLKRESSDAEWEFDEDELQLSSRSSSSGGAGYDNQMVKLLAKKMSQLPSEVQDVLKVAACIGNEVRENLLFHGCSSSVASSTVLLALSVAEERGVIIYNFDLGIGRFSHDRFQEAALSLIPCEQRQFYQFQIGRTLRAQLSETEFYNSLCLCASLMVQGIDHIEDEDEREKLARLCLAAARKAAKASAFSSAIQYIDFGMKLLTARHWRDQYDLSFQLFSTGCEMAYCNGDHELVERWVNEVVENARSWKDKVPVKITLILSLDSRWLFEEATELCFAILDHCGEHFPRKVGKAGIMIDFWKTQRMLRGKSARDILNLPPMTDQNALTAMSVIHLLYPVVLLSNFNLSPLTAFRLVRLTLRYGQSSMSSVGFAFYASVLVRQKRVEEGCFYGKLALQLMEKYPVKEFEARTTIALWGNVMTETEPLRKCLQPFMSAHRAGLSTGDFNSAMVAFYCQCLFRFFIGSDSLASVVELLHQAQQLSIDYNHMSMEEMTHPILQACYNLMGRAKDPLVLTGEAMDEEQWMARTRASDRMMNFFVVALKMFLSLYLDECDMANLREFRRTNPGVVIAYIYHYFMFFYGLVEAGNASSSPLSRWRAHRCLRHLERAMLRCPENFTNKVFLVKAVLYSSSGQDEYALLSFDKAIHYAEKEGLTNEKALANEKAAKMLLSSGRLAEAATYFGEAIKLYKNWGSELKVVQLQQLVAREKIDLGG